VALVGSGVLAIWNGIAEEAEADFVDWHVNEHIPERVGVPGFLRGRRYVALAGAPKYFNFYETETPAVLGSRAYLDRLNAPSDWTRRVVRHFRETSRTVCLVAASLGSGDGGCVAAIRLTAVAGADIRPHDFRARVMDPLLRAPGIIAVHLLQGQLEIGAGQTAEKELRDRPDQTAAWILLIEAVERGALDRAVGAQASPEMLKDSAAHYGPEDFGVYQLQYALDRSQLG
jgi:hypothetical protein